MGSRWRHGVSVAVYTCVLLVAVMCLQRANLTHVMESPFDVWPKLLNNQQINPRKICFGLRGKPVVFSLNRGLGPYIRD